MAEKRVRNYAAEYQRRNDLAKQRGFKSYGQQRHYVEFTGTPVSYITTIQPEEILEAYPTLTDYDYSEGQEKLHQAWMARSTRRGMSEEDAEANFRTLGANPTREKVKRLARRVFNLDWDKQWDTSG